MINKDKWLLEADHPKLSLQKWQQTIDLMAELYSSPASYVVQYTQHGFQTTIASTHKDNPYKAGEIIPLDTKIFCKKVIEDNHELYIKNAANDPYWQDNPEVLVDGFVSYYGMPIHWPDGTPFGTICVLDRKITDYQPPLDAVISQFRDVIETDLDLLLQYRRVHALSMTDEMTGLFNRRGFLALGEQKISIARRYGHSFGVLYLDLDKLKMINDTLGHGLGDEAIILLSQALKACLRDSDLAARLGGDEFAALVFLANDRELDALGQRTAERLRELASQTEHFKDLSVSVGSQWFDYHSDHTLQEMLDLADQKMYSQKNRG